MDKYSKPPKWIDWLLEQYCSSYMLEEIQGDLYELYQYRLAHLGFMKARVYYLWDVIRCAKPYAFKKKRKINNDMNRFDMLINLISLSMRRLFRQKSYSFINIAGLTLGIVCFTFIYLFVRHERSFDQFHEQKGNLYTVPFTWHFGTTVLPTAMATSNVGPLLKENYAEVEEFLRLKSKSSVVIANEKISEAAKMIYADSTFFQLLSFNLIEGNPKRALTAPNSIVLTEEMAAKYFGIEWRSKGLVGQLIQVGSLGDYTITGVVQNIPDNSHIQFDCLGSFSSLSEAKNVQNFDNSAYMTYVLLGSLVNPHELIRKIDADLLEGFGGERAIELGLRPISDIYLKSSLSTGVGPISDIKFVYIFMGIGLLIIVIACINYMNLATARSVERAKEVGVRKVMGAKRGQLIRQFLGESLLITFIAIILAICILYLLLPLFNTISQKDLIINLFSDTNLLGVLFVIWISVGLLAGVYPAFALSGFSVVAVLKGKFKYSVSGILLRRVLVIFQFSISVILIVGTIVIYKQLSFIQNANLGYDSESIISLPMDPESIKSIDVLKQKLLQQPEIISTSLTSQLPSAITFESTFAIKEGEENRQLLRVANIDDDYIKTLGLKLIASKAMSSSNTGNYEVVLNRSAASFFNWQPEEALGQKIKIWNSQWGEIVGVVEDYHFSSLHEKIKPLVLLNKEEEFNTMNNLMLRVDSKNLANTIASIESIWKENITYKPFSFNFLNENIDASYKKEQRLSKLFVIFSVLAIIIGCLGLFGLVSYSAFQKSREIGIRKVLGATSANIIMLLSMSFSKQVFIALIAGIFGSYWLMNKWLEGFEYRTSIGWDTALVATAITLGIAFFTMIFKSLQAALTNPAETLKCE